MPFLPVQDKPSPVYPGLHVHTGPSGASKHCALLSQLRVSSLQLALAPEVRKVSELVHK